MVRTKGHILLLSEGLETSAISIEDRDHSIEDFFTMRKEAMEQGDVFYAEESLFAHHFSFGDFYPGFIDMDWNHFSNTESLKGISQTIYQLYLLAFWEKPCLVSIGNDKFEAFRHSCSAGYNVPQKPDNYIYDRITRYRWHEEWYSNHQDQIQWDEPGQMQSHIFPCLERTLDILREELICHNIPVSEDPEQVVIDFHDKVMRHKGPEIHAYASEIGTKVCLANYYKEEQTLSTMERRKCGSLRKIFSLVTPNNKKHFLSIDFKHGMFELLDGKGCHIKEIHFDGSDNKAGSPEDHSLQTFDEWNQQGCPQ